MSHEIKEKASSRNGTLAGVLAFIITAVVLVLAGNLLFFKSGPKPEPVVLVETVGDAVVLRYADPSEQYTLKGIADSAFTPAKSTHIFYSEQYRVSESGESYDVVNSAGESVGSVRLLSRSTESEGTLSIDIAKADKDYYKIGTEYENVRIFSSDPSVTECFMSIEVGERKHSLDISIDNVTLRAPDFSPVIYSVSDADVNLKIKGNVRLIGGYNPFSTAEMSDAERVLSTMSTAANAYHVCMISAIGTVGSMLYGVDYYADMFERVTSLELNVMENTWGQIAGLFNGQNGADGLDGLPAIQLAGDLNIVGASSDMLSVKGGDGGNGRDGANGLMAESDGGNGGNGGEGVICNNLLTSQFYVYIAGGESGTSGNGGSSITGAQGNRGDAGSIGTDKVILGLEFSYSAEN